MPFDEGQTASARLNLQKPEFLRNDGNFLLRFMDMERK